MLISPSKKPKYLQRRFGARSKAHSQDSEAHQKYQFLLDNKKQKLSSRSDAVKAKLKSMQEKHMDDSESRFSRIEIKSKEAGEKRDLLLKQKSTSNANLVLRAKVIARVQHQKSKEELLVFQKNLEQRIRTTTFRRARNLLIPKSRLLDPKTRRESLVVQDEAALVIQDWFRERKFKPLVRVYRKVAVTKQIAKGMPFEQLMNRVQNQTTLKATTFLIIRAKRTAGLKSKWVKPARVLLLAYVIALHPNEMFTELNPQEQDLIGLAAQLITELEHYVNFTSPQVICPLAKSFILLFSDFYSAFENWKVKDFGKVINELVGHFIELDQLWISIRDNDNSTEEWGANIEKHQKMHFTRLKRYGDAAVASLLEARQQFKIDLEEAGTIVSISEDIPATSPATIYYKSNPKNVKRIDSVMDDAEIAIEVERPTTKDMEMFGPLLGNEQIVHEIALDPNFKLQPAVKNEAQIHVEKIAKQALADSMDSEIQRQDYTKKCLVILSDIRAVN